MDNARRIRKSLSLYQVLTSGICRNKKWIFVFILLGITFTAYATYQIIPMCQCWGNVERRVPTTLLIFHDNWLDTNTTGAVLLGDLNNDGIVNFVDFALWQKARNNGKE